MKAQRLYQDAVRRSRRANELVDLGELDPFDGLCEPPREPHRTIHFGATDLYRTPDYRPGIGYAIVALYYEDERFVRREIVETGFKTFSQANDEARRRNGDCPLDRG